MGFTVNFSRLLQARIEGQSRRWERIERRYCITRTFKSATEAFMLDLCWCILTGMRCFFSSLFLRAAWLNSMHNAYQWGINTFTVSCCKSSLLIPPNPPAHPSYLPELQSILCRNLEWVERSKKFEGNLSQHTVMYFFCCCCIYSNWDLNPIISAVWYEKATPHE